jgi:intracellular septation protein A
MNKIIELLTFVFRNFGPLLIFYSTNHFFGLKTAVAASIVWTAGEIVFHRIKKKPITTFFKFSASITIVFGMVDIYLQQSLLFKYEAALSNVIVGIFFTSSLFGKKPIILEFAEAQGRISSELSQDGEYYFKFLTVVWSLYSFIKAGFYTWVASNYPLEEGLAIRGVVGNATFYGLMLISIFGSKQIKFALAKLKMLPSSRKQGRPPSS